MPDASDQHTLKWGDSFDLLSDERKSELRERLLSWTPDQVTKTHPGPFAGERLNGLEVFWLAACALAGIDGDPTIIVRMITGPSSRRGVHLPTINLSGTDLSGAYLREAELHGVDLRWVSLRGADLWQANLSRANLSHANLAGAFLQRTNFYHANLQQTSLPLANMCLADMRHVELLGAYLAEANLSGANLQDAKMQNANLSRADLSRADLSRANLTGSSLREAQLVRTNFSCASLAGSAIYGAAVWNVTLDGATQINLRITPDNEGEITTDNLEMAQFIYLMLHNEKIREVIDSLTSKVVLILGRFTPERKRILDALRDELRHHNYVPVVFDFEKPVGSTTTETVTLLARMARFVIADLTDPGSVPYELAKIIPDAHVPVQTLLLEGERTFSMAKDLWQLHPHLMLPLCRYTTLEELLATLSDRVIAPAEAKAAELQRRRILPVDGL